MRVQIPFLFVVFVILCCFGFSLVSANARAPSKEILAKVYAERGITPLAALNIYNTEKKIKRLIAEDGDDDDDGDDGDDGDCEASSSESESSESDDGYDEDYNDDDDEDDGDDDEGDEGDDGDDGGDGGIGGGDGGGGDGGGGFGGDGGGGGGGADDDDRHDEDKKKRSEKRAKVCKPKKTTCEGNCPRDTCTNCTCGIVAAPVDIAGICSHGTWGQACCQCIASHESNGNANAINVNPNGSTDIGLFQINSANWAACNAGNAPCSTAANLACAQDVYKWGGNSFSLWSTCGACGCC